MRLSISRPRACPKESSGRPKMAGISQFQRLITTKPASAINSATRRTNFRPRSSQKERFIYLLLGGCEWEFWGGAPLAAGCLIGEQVGVEVLQFGAQLLHGVVLARN